MIYGIGTDVVAVARIERLLLRYGERFVARVLSPSERPGFAATPRPTAFLAKRFAAKEAFAKALGTGLRAPVTLTGIEIVHDEQGRPMLAFGDELLKLLRARGIVRWHLSISDERDYACAFVVLEQ